MKNTYTITGHLTRPGWFACLKSNLLGLALLLSLPGVAAPLATAPSVAVSTTTAPALAGALTPDGSLRPKVRGSFDATGYELLTAPDGHPLFRPAGAKRTLGVGDDRWQGGFGASGLNGNVFALTVVPNGDVLVGGAFTDAGGNPNADRVARWDGSAWQPLGTGLNSLVNALAVAANGDVLAGGNFTDAGGNASADYVARWTGTTWQPLGTGLNGGVNALAVAPNGDVLAGGTFVNVGGTQSANHVARWNGTTWQPLGTGLNDIVTTLAVTATGNVLVGGLFTDAGGNPNADRVARWDGSAWQPLGTGLNSLVNALAVAANGDVLAGGNFTDAGGNANADYVARWNGTAWQPLGTGANGVVLALVVASNGDVLVGGNPLNAGGNPNADYVARWDGTTWQALGTGLNSTVQALALTPDGRLAAGGTFTAVGDGSKLTRHFGLYTLGTPALAVGGISPASGPAGTVVSLTGTSLTGATAITFTPSGGGTATSAASTYTVASATSITGVVVPAGLAPGTYTVTVTTPDGTSNGLTFTVTVPVPAISSFTPASGPAGTSVTITGTNLNLVTGVRFGTGTLTTNFVSQSATSLTVLVPVVAATGPLTLTDNTGTSVSSATNFTYTPRLDLVATLSPTGPLDACQPRTLTASATTAAFGTGTGFDGYVQTVVAQADGKVLVGGNFTTYQGTAASRLVRLNADGSRDASFAVGNGFNGLVQSIAVQADGKVLVGGNFTQYDGTAAPYLVRLNADGSRDTSFNIGTGFSSFVYAVALQADGKVLVGGLYSNFNGTAGLNRLVRLNADGSRDTGFSIGTGFNGSVAAIAVQADGKVLVGGQFTQYKSTTQNRLMRLNADGSRDASFTLAGTGFGNTILSLVVQADGKVLAGGQFTSYSGTSANSLVRLNADGSRDTGFVVGTGFNDYVQHLALQADGKVLVVGDFSGYQGAAAGRMARLNADGDRDAGFTTIGTGFSSTVYAVAVQADDKILVGGDFARYGGAVAAGLQRLTADGSRNDVPSAVSGVTFTFSPGGSTTNPLVTSTAGSYTATASLDGSTSAASNAVVLTACAVPTLTAINPASGPIGTSVTLTGTNLGGATSVSFNGTTQTTIANNTGTSLTVVVPNGATTGSVTVTTPNGTSNGLTFMVIPPSLVISTTQGVAVGTYQDIMVLADGRALLAGDITVLGTMQVQAGGIVQTIGNGCAVIGGSGSFVLEAGAQLSICSPQGISASGATGNVQVTGTRSFSPQAVYLYDLPGAQVTGSGLPAEVSLLGKFDTGTLTLSQPVAIRQALYIFSAGDIATNGQGLTLLSDATGTALLANLGTGQVLGNLTVQRYVAGTLNAGLGYRHLSAPVTEQTVAAFASGGTAQVVNPAYNSSATPNLVTPYPTVFSYDQARLATSPATSLLAFGKGWESPAALNAPAPLGTQGFTVQLPGASTLSFSGPARQTAINLPMSRGAGTEAGWNFVGNPYAAPLDFSTVPASQLTNVDAALYVFESTSQYGGAYRSYVNGVGNPLIGSSQGFWMRVSPGQTSGSLALTNANRVTDPGQQNIVRRGAADTRPQLTLALAGAGLSDALTLYAQAGATAAFDGRFDAAKLPNSHGLNLAALAATGEALAIDGRADFARPTAIPLTVGVPAPGAYTLTAAALANLPAGTGAELMDTQTGTRTLLTTGARYAFTTATTTAPGRFWLHLTPAAAPLATATGALAAQTLVYPNPAHSSFTLTLPSVAGATQATATLLNALGQVVNTRTLALATGGATTTYATAGLAAGVYALRLQAGKETVTLRVVVE